MTDIERSRVVAIAISNGIKLGGTAPTPDGRYTCDCCPVMCPVCDCTRGPDGISAKLAKQWLADHPEKPAEPETVSKYATRGESSYSLTLKVERISVYHWHGDYESVDFNGTADEFNQFDEENPEEWFSLAAKMIARKGKK
jgi:hypothetical protein